MSQTLYAQTRALIDRHGLVAKKSLGQNFLVDAHVLKKIISAADISPDDLVIEIGPGLGALTRELAANARQVVAVEIDRRLIPALEETLAGVSNVSVIQGDAMKLDLSEVVGESKFKVCANLPYNIATTLTINMLSSSPKPAVLTLMIQREVCDRLLASPGSKSYGALSVIRDYLAEGERAANVPSNSFLPRPAVDSAVISLRPKPPALSGAAEALFFAVVKAAFAKRRKTLANCLSSSDIGIGKQAAHDLLERLSLRPDARGEALTTAQFIDLAYSLYYSPTPSGNCLS